MREKLIELLSVVTCPNKICNFCEHFENGVACERHRNEVIADHLISHGVTVQEWIPVSERLPELDVDVLAFNGDYIFISQYYISHFGSWDKVGHMCWMKDQYAKNPTHWMPLPSKDGLK